jgi:phosphate transport system protein
MRRLQRMIGEKRREQFELDRLLEALGDRFFPTRPTRAKSIRSFDVEITRAGTWWKIQIPEIGGWTKTRRREDADMIAREHIAVIIGAPIADVAVRVVNGSSSRSALTGSPRGGCFGPGQTYSDIVRTAYHEQLAALTAQLGEMCGLAGVAMERATHALLQADLVAAEQVINDHEQLAAMSSRAVENAFVLLALQQPVAGELRAIVSSIQIAADLERMGGLAVHVAKITRRRHPEHALPEQVNGHFAEMGRIAVELGNATKEVVLSRDPRRAAQIRHDDDAMDDLHRQLFSVLMDRGWKHGVAAAIDITLLGRFYERFADHAVQIARRVIFQATGKLHGSSI